MLIFFTFPLQKIKATTATTIQSLSLKWFKVRYNLKVFYKLKFNLCLMSSCGQLLAV